MDINSNEISNIDENAFIRFVNLLSESPFCFPSQLYIRLANVLVPRQSFFLE